MTPKRLLLLLLAAGGAGQLLGASQTWFGLTLVDGRQLEVSGSVAAGAVAATGIAALAAMAALSIAPRIPRYILAALALLAGLTGAVVAWRAVADPVRAGAALLAEQTGVSGPQAQAALVEQVGVQPWPFIALAGCLLAVLGGTGVLITAGRWPVTGAKYEREGGTRTESRAGNGPDDWDALTEGDDPTR